VFGYAALAQAPFASLGESAMPVDFADTATISTTTSATNSFGGVLADTTTLTDTVNAAATYLVYIADTATGTDTFAAAATFGVGFADTATITDTPSVVATIVASVTGIQLYVYVGNTLVWEVIDDSQNANWQNINDAQTPGWVNVPT
jgi:hypothetical protein